MPWSRWGSEPVSIFTPTFGLCIKRKVTTDRPAAVNVPLIRRNLRAGYRLWFSCCLVPNLFPSASPLSDVPEGRALIDVQSRHVVEGSESES